jgi:hypothetical protein
METDPSSTPSPPGIDLLEDVITPDEMMEFQGFSEIYNNNVEKFVEKTPNKEILFSTISIIMKHTTTATRRQDESKTK